MKLNNSHVKFLFDRNENFNVFNLVRLLRDNKNSDELILDISGMETRHQELIVGKFSVFLYLYMKLITISQHSATLIVSKVHSSLIDIVCTRDRAIEEDNTLIFELQHLIPQKNNNKNPHFVKNIRGAVLLSLVQDLIDIEKVGGQVLIFNEKSPLLLHAASDFLNNEENALMMWEVLNAWEVEHEQGYKAEINRRIQLSLKAKKELDILLKELSRGSSTNNTLSNFIGQMQSNIGLPKNIYTSTQNLKIWFVDDQHANGWYKLIKNSIPDTNVEVTALNGVEDVKHCLELSSFKGVGIIPDLALVDLRLSESDQVVESYDAEELSGFSVVDLLLGCWRGLPIMITSASSKLCNMEKAIERGAVAYWRKSDEVYDCGSKNAVLTAFDINLQFIEKLTQALKRARYKFVFRIVENLRIKVKPLAIKYSSLQRCIENYTTELEQKTSWMCWQKTCDTKINDSLYLGVMELFNEIEPLLWNRGSENLVFDPSKKIRFKSQSTDSQLINDSLDFLDSKYEITGIGLKSHYEKCKSIRNKLPIIHGSAAAKNVKHASLADIEISLLIVWCLLNELVNEKK
ncbi:response regulator [Shewanella kaireitica]|uniref:response regulator n=1 Tax=Shewanella kaireitica TaxID=212021 RepID=UPI00200D08B5|nr:response regulator [Shewanella kaireitica]MCL1093665.1 response regulator [Shewanella kaireitica]